MASTKLAFLAVAVLLLLGHMDQSCSSPAVSSPQDGAAAVMTLTSFQEGGDGGGPAACDDKYHEDWVPLVALSTAFYAGGSRCNKPIQITSTQNSVTVVAAVVDECDSQSGCADNIVAASQAVWDKLGLNSNIGEVPITWSDL